MRMHVSFADISPPSFSSQPVKQLSHYLCPISICHATISHASYTCNLYIEYPYNYFVHICIIKVSNILSFSLNSIRAE